MDVALSWRQLQCAGQATHQMSCYHPIVEHKVMAELPQFHSPENSLKIRSYSLILGIGETVKFHERYIHQQMVVSKRGFDMFRQQNNGVDCSFVKGNPLFLGYCTPFTFIEKDSSEGKMGTVANQQLCAGWWLQCLWKIWKISDGTFISNVFCWCHVFPFSNMTPCL